MYGERPDVTDAAPSVRSRVLRLLTAFCLLVLPIATGCDEDIHDEAGSPRPTPTIAGEVASFSFEAVAYVDPSASSVAVLDRVRYVTRSGVSALQHRRITMSQKRQVDIDLKRLTREPVTVVDPGTKASHPAVRVRYRFVGIGVVPKELAQRGEALLGLLHSADAARAGEVVEACNDPAERAGDAVKQPWRAFDPEREACGRAMEAEQSRIDAARAGLEHPEREIVPSEESRLYLPVLLRMRTRAAKTPRAAVTPSEVERTPVAVAGREAPAKPSGSAIKPGGQAHADSESADPFADSDPAVVLARRSEARLLAKVKEQDRDTGRGQNDFALEDEMLRRPAAGGPGEDSGSQGQPVHYGSSAPESPTNYLLLWVASVAVLAIFGAEIQRRFKRRR